MSIENGLCVVLADTSDLFRQALAAALLQLPGVAVTETVQSLEEVMPCIKRLRPDLIILDLAISKGDSRAGRRLLACLGRQARGPKVFVLTQDPSPQLRAHLMAAGVFAQFDKALEIPRLLNVVSHLQVRGYLPEVPVETDK